ncbi:golgin subfamily A member 8C-like isoform X2 [Anneissia japonica]|uniref:golgin subfamily A member 8C-like isoform X2 n=1 Tax=Anneissia japonica TaxID=1529436 RepID=UPI001425A131|nr:golgin subfamily A member 8C-like isoform X2 [Anneissia japonica]
MVLINLLTRNTAVEKENHVALLQRELKQLEYKLKQANDQVAELTKRLEMQSSKTRQLIAGWKLELQDRENSLDKQLKEKDKQLNDICAELIHFEATLKKERNSIVQQLNEKDKKIKEQDRRIKEQEKHIKALNSANERLLESLHESRVSSSPPSSPASPSSLSSSPSATSPSGLLNNNNIVFSPHYKHIRHNGNTSSPRTVRFSEDVRDNEEKKPTPKSAIRIRKISLPAYRLPEDEEDIVRYC